MSPAAMHETSPPTAPSAHPVPHSTLPVDLQSPAARPLCPPSTASTNIFWGTAMTLVVGIVVAIGCAARYHKELGFRGRPVRRGHVVVADAHHAADERRLWVPSGMGDGDMGRAEVLLGELDELRVADWSMSIELNNELIGTQPQHIDDEDSTTMVEKYLIVVEWQPRTHVHFPTCDQSHDGHPAHSPQDQRVLGRLCVCLKITRGDERQVLKSENGVTGPDPCAVGAVRLYSDREEQLTINLVIPSSTSENGGIKRIRALKRSIEVGFEAPLPAAVRRVGELEGGRRRLMGLVPSHSAGSWPSKSRPATMDCESSPGLRELLPQVWRCLFIVQTGNKHTSEDWPRVRRTEEEGAATGVGVALGSAGEGRDAAKRVVQSTGFKTKCGDRVGIRRWLVVDFVSTGQDAAHGSGRHRQLVET
ncbi:hypothetical protein DFP72DRAFT_844943 [Ephemerocybe angulata]|uniref:Uncharacterized protein n=1 Tax=Ephemerocybe angulata TaxID=980116 RepID=A0A8H6I4F9_9AGAR|nr:hypothetical protein DFP72DRAFT_844943 [Tulosesus angulatus]